MQSPEEGPDGNGPCFGDGPVLAIAKFAFDGKNNDELTFSRNDIITVTQHLEGGWWEGTFQGVTGWFPSNYVTILTERDKLMRSKSVPSTAVAAAQVAAANMSLGPAGEFREEVNCLIISLALLKVLNTFMDAERTHVRELREAYTNFLTPLRDSKKLSEKDFATLSGNFEQVIFVHGELATNIAATRENEPSQQRVGGILLQSAPELKELLVSYCSNHPSAVEVITKHKDSINEVLGPLKASTKELIKALSLPFRHLDKYPIALQEIERNIPESHADRGDVQRAIAVYKDIKQYCDWTRKHRELQLELAPVLASFLSNPSEPNPLPIHISSVGVEKTGVESDILDKYAAVYPTEILLLNTPDGTKYQLSEKLELSGIVIRRLEPPAHGFEILKDGNSLYVFTVSSNFEVERWLEALNRCSGVVCEETVVSQATPRRFNYSVTHNMHEISPTRRAEVSNLPTSERAAHIDKKGSFGDILVDHELGMICPEPTDDEDGNSGRTRRVGGPLLTEEFSLQPAPAQRRMATERRNAPIRLRRNAEQDDAALLRLVESYCATAKRYGGGRREGAPNGGHLPPQLIVAEEEKLLVEEIVGDEVVIKEKSLVDTVYALKDQINEMQKTLINLTKKVDTEAKGRRRLEEALRRNSGSQNTPAAGGASPSSPPQPTTTPS